MALLFMDSFDHYATADITEKWTSLDSANAAIGAYGRNSTNGLWLPNTANRTGMYATVLGGIDEAIVGFAMKIQTNANPSLNCGFLAFGSASSWQCGICLNGDLTLQPFRGSAGWWNNPGETMQWATLLGSASSVALQVGVWAYIEVRMKCHDSAGTCVVRVNGIEVLNLSGLDTSDTSTTLTRIGIGGTGTFAASFYFDDLVVMDTTGSVNNTFLGDVTVSALYPSGAGTTSGWTPSAGSNYQNVDEAAPNDDTDYNSTATLNAKDTYAMQDCAVGADIRAVQILAAVRKGSEGPGQVKLVVRSGGADYDGAAKGIGGTAYSYVREVYETDPGSGSPAGAWTESNWNAVEIGLKKTG